MTSRLLRLTPAILLVVVAILQGPITAAGEVPAAAKVLADRTIRNLRPVPLVSPNGRYVAFVNRGYVCVADVEAGTSRRLVEVPCIWTHVFAKETSEGGSPDSLVRTLNRERYKELESSVKDEIGEFAWTVDSSAIVFSVHSHDAVKATTQVHIWRAPLEGEAKVIASNERSLTSRRGPGGVLTRDGRFLVGNFGRERAFIWDVTANKPRATPFNYLAPSSTSGRWIGVEKDTRQLVVVDDDFEIIRRYEEILPENQFGFDMIWSPDERFVLWRQQVGFDYYSNWVGCRYDLETRERNIFTGDYMGEKLAFTGNRGEFVRVGAAGVQGNDSGLKLTEQYVGIVPDGRLHLQRFWYQRSDPSDMVSDVRIASMSNVIWSPDLQLFTIGLPRQEGPHGEIIHLADRHRHLWKLPGDDTGRYVSPCHVAGFALDGKAIIAYDETRLFSLPVAAIQSSENKVR
ncbi:hypothetical protein [Lacipirellula parvula]|uniref:Uncharacterized protein n=1 Tax=Lacipirellula parvula TaxID=2650471 RepID=A0A5K7X6U4_9BACT|nr:hypothetical protein [Lacipirellula parvula]BBO32310.1 hypothetical protein PLANPX_1922 [Lacipirellula parvula]